MDPTTLVAVAAATVASLLGSLIVSVAGWMEARRGERHAVERAILAERLMLRAENRAGKIAVATEAIRQAAGALAEHDMARHLGGWESLRRACRLHDRAVADLDEDTAETVNPARM